MTAPAFQEPKDVDSRSLPWNLTPSDRPRLLQSARRYLAMGRSLEQTYMTFGVPMDQLEQIAAEHPGPIARSAPVSKPPPAAAAPDPSPATGGHQAASVPEVPSPAAGVDAKSPREGAFFALGRALEHDRPLIRRAAERAGEALDRLAELLAADAKDAERRRELEDAQKAVEAAQARLRELRDAGKPPPSSSTPKPPRIAKVPPNCPGCGRPFLPSRGRYPRLCASCRSAS